MGIREKKEKRRGGDTKLNRVDSKGGRFKGWEELEKGIIIIKIPCMIFSKN